MRLQPHGNCLQLRITEAVLYAELGPAQLPLSVPFRNPRPLPAAAADPLPLPERNVRRQRSQQPGAGAAAVPRCHGARAAALAAE